MFVSYNSVFFCINDFYRYLISVPAGRRRMGGGDLDRVNAGSVMVNPVLQISRIIK